MSTRTDLLCPRVLTIGYLTTDLLLKVKRFADTDEEVPIETIGEYQGGSAANTAVGLSRLGIPAGLLTCTGNDDRGRKGVQLLALEGVDVSRVVTSPTGLGSAYVVGAVDAHGERQLYTYAGASEELTPEQLTPEVLTETTHVHICTLGPEFVERALALADSADHKITISIDPGTLGCAAERGARLRQLLPRLDLAFVNSVELRLLTGIADPQQVTQHADVLPSRLVVKLGANGCLLYRRHGDILPSPAFSVEAADTTGAGDAFAAGYLAGWIEGLPDEQLAAFSNAVAALSTRVVGCRDGLPVMDQVLTFLRARGMSILPA